MDTLKCGTCGRKADNEAAYCRHCGAPIALPAQGSQKFHPVTRLFIGFLGLFIAFIIIIGVATSGRPAPAQQAAAAQPQTSAQPITTQEPTDWKAIDLERVTAFASGLMELVHATDIDNSDFQRAFGEAESNADTISLYAAIAAYRDDTKELADKAAALDSPGLSIDGWQDALSQSKTDAINALNAKHLALERIAGAIDSGQFRPSDGNAMRQLLQGSQMLLLRAALRLDGPYKALGYKLEDIDSDTMTPYSPEQLTAKKAKHRHKHKQETPDDLPVATNFEDAQPKPNSYDHGEYYHAPDQ